MIHDYAIARALNTALATNMAAKLAIVATELFNDYAIGLDGEGNFVETEAVAPLLLSTPDIYYQEELAPVSVPAITTLVDTGGTVDNPDFDGTFEDDARAVVILTVGDSNPTKVQLMAYCYREAIKRILLNPALNNLKILNADVSALGLQRDYTPSYQRESDGLLCKEIYNELSINSLEQGV